MVFSTFPLEFKRDNSMSRFGKSAMGSVVTLNSAAPTAVNLNQSSSPFAPISPERENLESVIAKALAKFEP